MEFLGKLFLPECEVANEFIKDVQEIQSLLVNFNSNNRNVHLNVDTKEIYEKIDKVRNEHAHMPEISQFLRAASEASSSSKHDSDVQILFYTELAMNKFILEKNYIQEVKHIIANRKKLIVKEFCPNLEDKIDNIKFKIQLTKGETHNQGKKPVYVEAYIDGKRVFKIVYKPRKVEIDQLVIQLFHEINQSQLEKHQIPLPTYKIIPLTDHEGSFWEFIDTEKKMRKELDCNDRVKAISVLKNLCEKDPKYKKDSKETMSNFYRLNTILSAIHVGDLHKDNIIIRPVPSDSTKLEVVPIDLENIVKVGEATGLIGNEKLSTVALSLAEKTLIENFNQKNLPPFRVVIIGTMSLAALVGDVNSVDRCVDLVSENMQKQGFTASISK